MFSGGSVDISQLKKIKFHAMKKSGENNVRSMIYALVVSILDYFLLQFRL